jgi:hypothetical protein
MKFIALTIKVSEILIIASKFLCDGYQQPREDVPVTWEVEFLDQEFDPYEL